MSSRPTQDDIAREAGVSRGLVSLALSGSSTVADSTRERILAVAERLGYTRNLSAAMLAARTSPIVGIVLPNLMHPFFDSMVSSIQSVADDLGKMAFTAIRGEMQTNESCALDYFIGLRVGGAVLVAPTLPKDRLIEYGTKIPTCVIAGDVVGGTIDSVYIDEDAAAKLVLTHLNEAGYEKIVFFTRETTAADELVHRRVESFTSAVSATGVKPDVRVVHDVDSSVRDLIHEGGPRTAIVCYNDPLAMDVVMAARALGLEPGADIGVVGYDNTFYAEKPGYDITSIDPKPHEMAAAALDFVTSRAEQLALDARHHLVQPALIVRGSTSR
ncbi:MAG: LacI family DNA-binding transcriptional regulator [Actinomycetaceae bacterium]|nr:LacI family DNA-binding transcriptional regulator [Actinomycetaceae bacterium]